jgi:TPR repeat protein
MLDCGSCAAPSAPSLCSACKFAAYCGPPCQRAAWAAHKAVCKAIKADVATTPDGIDSRKTHCDGCEELLDGRNELCTRCRSVSYCSAACQAAHWPAAHAAVCRSVGEAKFARMMVLAVAGDAGAMCSVGTFYAYGTGVTRDEREMVLWFHRAAELGQVSAQFNLACCYKHGKGVEKDARGAVKWYRRAADQGYVNAQFILGVCYATGNGIETDARAAVKWYRRAAVAGEAVAQYNLGHCYSAGKGVEKDEQAAFEWIHCAALAGYANAQTSLGYRYEKGIGVEKDARLAVEWYRRAAATGDADAQFNLGATSAASASRLMHARRSSGTGAPLARPTTPTPPSRRSPRSCA